MNLAELIGLHTLEAFGTYQDGAGADASDWIINDIQIGNRSQFAQAGNVPGDMFAGGAIDSFVSFETAQVAMDIVLTATNVGAKEASFHGAFLGRDAASGAREVVPMASAIKVQPEQTVQITARPQRVAFRPERLMIANTHKATHVLLALSGGLYDFSDKGVVKVEDEERSDAFLETMMPVLTSEPDLVFLRLHGDTLLYGVSERTGLVVFEAGMIKQHIFDDDEEEDVFEYDGIPYGPRAPRVVTKHFLRFDLEGFVPEWLSSELTETRPPSTSELRSAHEQTPP
jgi:hypothetical protein